MDNVFVFQVRRKTTEESEEVYETELAQLFSAEDEVQVFFAKLDGELNKINQFYKKQETEFIERGEMLSKQLNILLDLKQILSDRHKKNPSLKPSNTGVFPHPPGQGSNYSRHFFIYSFLVKYKISWIGKKQTNQLSIINM